MSAPWFPFTDAELALLKRCRTIRQGVVLTVSLMLSANLRHDAPRVTYTRPLRRADVDERGGWHQRLTRQILEELEALGVVRRNRRGRSKFDCTAEFQLEFDFGAGARLVDDPGARLVDDPGARLVDDPGNPPTPYPGGSDRTYVRRVHARARTSARARERGRKDERTNEQILSDPVTRLACKLFEIEPAAAQRYVDKARAFPLAPTDAELAWWLPLAARNDSILKADVPLSVALCEWRLRRAIEPNRKAQARRDAEPEPERAAAPRVAPRERIALATAALAAVKGGAR